MTGQMQQMIDLGLISPNTAKSFISISDQIERNLMGNRVKVKMPTYSVAKETIQRWYNKGEITSAEYHERMVILLSGEKGLIDGQEVHKQTVAVQDKYRDAHLREKKSIHDLTAEAPF